ncbi:NUDIX hydrolase [Kitasatospora sp. NPDC059327]|uniref:NUDIX hydrolase n=1 Tax=Kitasatospora sp. NPDC059327 TaxID=3346803 RepID=UPI0036B9D3A4
MVLKRWTSRVLLVDERDRLLLLCGRDPRKPGARWWFTVGGGVEHGEDYVQAAVREVREETALSLPAERLSALLWTRRSLLTVDGQRSDQYEEYRLARVTAAEADSVRIDTDEACYGHRWWAAEELAATPEAVRPKGMASHLARVLTATAGPRPEPVLHLGDFDEDTDPA